MASALASPPPLLSGGSPDLKRNARKFLERALVVSALVHLAAVGAFRAAEERSRAREGDEVKRVPGIVDLIPHLFPPPVIRNWSPPAAPPSTSGIITPVQKIERPEVDITPPGDFYPPETVTPSRGEGGKGGAATTPDAPTEEPLRPFTAVDTPPVPLQAPRPPYPEWAREAGIEGTVVLKVLVGVDGIPKQVEILRGPKGLRDEAARAVSRWTFTPGLSNHRPVEVWVEVPVVFTLQ